METSWYNMLTESFATPTVFSCFTNATNCSLYEIATERDEFIEKALQVKQPANIEEYRCVGMVFSFDMLQQAWITLPCDMKFSATFVCENIPNKTTTDTYVVRTSFQFQGQADHMILRRPYVSCPYPWLPSEQVCFTFLPTNRPKEILGTEWFAEKCTSLNATLLTFPSVFIEKGRILPGINSEGDILNSMILEMSNKGYDVLVMGSDEQSHCVYLYRSTYAVEKTVCTAKNITTLPDTFHIACINSFPGVTLAYNETATYTCNSTGTIISAYFLCDGIAQCKNGEDEMNCNINNIPLPTDWRCSPFELQMHKNADCRMLCPELYIACGNGMCIPQDALCNGFRDCEDGWDEQICAFTYSQLSFVTSNNASSSLHAYCDDKSMYNKNYQCIFEVDGNGNMLHCSDGSHLQRCKTSGCQYAFKCSFAFCIPLRQVCDGMSDCPDGDDEVNCELLQCTGLFQCRESASCLPPWDICDGTVHCKDFLDDEIYCAPCPHGLRCHGNAAVCTNISNVLMESIQAKSQSRIKALTCQHQAYLTLLSSVEWIALTFLDLQHSQISDIDLSLFPNMMSLSYLNAAFNKIASIASIKLTSPLKIINLSHNIIVKLGKFELSMFQSLITLVLHHNDISVIQRWAFIGLEALYSVDLTNNPLVSQGISDLPQHSLRLEHFHSDLLAFCCLLSDVPHCIPQSSLFSSCDNLLHLIVHRVLILEQAIFTLLANAAVFIFRRHLSKKERFQMFHLTASNLLMSAYLVLMAAVDIYYRNRFSSIAVGWNYFSLCKIAAAGNMVAAEVSLSLLLFIFVLRAYSVHKFYHKTSTRLRNIVSFTIWAVWVVYTSAIVGLFSFTDVALESNICILVFFNEVTRNWLVLTHNAVYAVVNLIKIISLIITFIVIAHGALRNRILLGDTSANMTRRKRTISIRLFTIFFFNTCCWIPVIVSVILSIFGVPLPNNVSVWMAIVVIPINASFCPIMYCLMPMLVNVRKKK